MLTKHNYYTIRKLLSSLTELLPTMATKQCLLNKVFNPATKQGLNTEGMSDWLART